MTPWYHVGLRRGRHMRDDSKVYRNSYSLINGGYGDIISGEFLDSLPVLLRVSIRILLRRFS